ncbi:tRNA(Glu)-specific nuclease WapA precursor [Ruminiclostridium hungatei]|uniref:tRNA(Glu)-specific nuclease WapA n=2 Tax=Ruminiclostridium hungatei TaxID=48256 RepID=A0A1V4SLS7_RUMHU|nr:tRNA(Glu)-specific nuclease WapA precursor [Ruminiclostridium hungatei]
MEQTREIDPSNPPKAKFGMYIEGQKDGATKNAKPIVAGTASYEYDMWNQMVKATTGEGTSTYTYNGEGYRTEKTENGKTTRSLYEGDKVILETDENGKQTARNIYGTNLIQRTVTTRENGNTKEETYSYMYNGHGDVTALLGADGTLAASYYYDAFGNALETHYYNASGTEISKAVDNPYRYAGYVYDSTTDLYYLNARMYDAKTARFLQEDTYLGTASDPLSLNLYTYCANNPVIYIDPTGHYKEGDEKYSVTVQEKLYLYGLAYADAKTDKDKKDAANAANALRQQAEAKEDYLYTPNANNEDIAYALGLTAKAKAACNNTTTANVTANKSTTDAGRNTSGSNANSATNTETIEKEKFANQYYSDAVQYYNYRKDTNMFWIPYSNTVKIYMEALDYAVKKNLIDKNSSDYKLAVANIYLSAYSQGDIAADSYLHIIENTDPSIMMFAAALKSLEKSGKFTTNEISDLQNSYEKMNIERTSKAAVPMSIEMVGEDANFEAAANRIKPMQGYTDVVVHGDANSFYVLNKGQWVQIDQRSMATYLKSNGYTGGPIRLISCETGSLPNGIAQNLSNKLGTEVIAPSNTVWIQPNGSLTIGRTGQVNTGRWNTFTPGKP